MEMNMFMPRTLKSSMELRELALIPTQIVTPAKSKTIVGILQDALLACYKSTVDPTPTVFQKRYFNILSQNDGFNGMPVFKNKYNGHDIITTALPPINFHIGEKKSVDPAYDAIKKFIKYIKSEALIDHVDDINYLEVKYIKDGVISKIDDIIKTHGSTFNKNQIKILEYIKTKILEKKTIKLENTLAKLESVTKPNATKMVAKFDITQGNFTTGILNKSQLSTGGGTSNLIYITWQDYGPDVAKNMIDRIQKVANAWLIEAGHTIGAGDMVIHDKDTRDEITLEILKSLTAYDELRDKVSKGSLIAGVGRSVEDEFEQQGLTIFNDLFSGKLPMIISDYFKKLPQGIGINFENMVEAGSKGKMINVTQIMGCLGQQAIEAKRIPKTYGERSLPCYEKFDDSAQARGFIKNSFVTGLDPDEFFFSQSAGREGSIDTAIKTADSGYISRKLMKSMEDLMVHHDMVVRNSVGRIIQFTYGDNSMNPIYTEYVKLNLINYDFAKLKSIYKFTIDDMKNVLDPEIYKQVTEKSRLEETKKLIGEEYLKILYFQKLLRHYIFSQENSADISALMACDITRIINNAIVQFGLEGNVPDKSLIDPTYIVKKVNGLCQILPTLFGITNYHIEKGIPENATLDDELIEGLTEEELLDTKFRIDMSKYFTLMDREHNHFVHSILLFKIYLKSILCSKNVIMHYRLTQEVFDYVLDTIIYKFSRCIVNSGEMVGAIAAQSIGEPTTQATLNTFHLAGVARGSAVISGVPRIKELLSVSKEIKTPFVDVYLEPEFIEDKSRAKVIANNIEYTTLRAFTESADVYFDPNPRETIIPEDKEFVKAFFRYSLRPVNTSKLSKFMIRIELKKKMMVYKQMRMFYVKYMIESFGHGQYEVISSDDNADRLVLHVRLNMSLVTQKSKDELELITQDKDVILDDVVIRGIKDITSAQIGKGGDKLIIYDPENGDRKQVDQWAVYTSGSNLIKVLEQPGVDPVRTSSNDVNEIYKLFGIEAARQLLYNQLNITYSESADTINFHHLSLLVDLQTYFGQLMPISRHGINRTDNSAITKASFEETLEQLSEAAGYAITDNMHGISANIAAGQMMPAGTGALFDLVYDAQETGVTETEIEEIFGGDF